MRTWRPLANHSFTEQESGAPPGEEGVHPVPSVCPSYFLICPVARLFAPPPSSALGRAQPLLHGYSVSFHLWYCIRYLVAAVMKHSGQGNLEKEEFTWLTGSNGLGSIRGGEKHSLEPQPWQRSRCESCLLTSSNPSMNWNAWAGSGVSF